MNLSIITEGDKKPDIGGFRELTRAYKWIYDVMMLDDGWRQVTITKAVEVKENVYVGYIKGQVGDICSLTRSDSVDIDQNDPVVQFIARAIIDDNLDIISEGE